MHCDKEIVFSKREIDCPCDHFQLGENHKLQFYESFKWMKEEFFVGDFAKIRNSDNKTQVCKLLCFYKSNYVEHSETPNRAYIQPYVNATDIADAYSSYVKLKHFEIVEDHCLLDLFINLEDILCKCNVIFASHKLEPEFINNFAIEEGYLCRYKVIESKKCVQLQPLNKYSKLAIKMIKRKGNIENECNDDGALKSLSSHTPKKKKNVEILTPNKASRNLNDSFAKSDSQTGTPILNYSIIESTLDYEPANTNSEKASSKEVGNIKIKLRLSQMQPQLILEKLENDLIDKLSLKSPTNEGPRLRKRIPPKKDDVPVEVPVRRSSRVSISRVSYADYELTPPKRSRRLSFASDTSESDKVSNASQKIEKISIKSPQKPAAKSGRKQSTTLKEIRENEPLKVSRTRRASTISITSDFSERPDDDFQDNFKESFRTPKKKNKIEVSTPKSSTSTIKLLRNGLITPTMRFRETSVAKNLTPLNNAKAKLHVSHVPQSLPCREKEFQDIFSFVQGKLLDGCGGCIYISGVPGTGKTATVTEVIRQLEISREREKLPMFTFIGINGMRLTEPRQAYVEIHRQMTGKTVPWEQAQSLLNTKFTKSKKEKAIVLLVDELDILCTKRQDVVYNLLDWPTKATSQLIVLTIANTMDLPERLLMGRVTSRLGLTRLTFQAYTHKQLQEIVTKRLTGTEAFKPDAIQLVARKVASVSGDARRALDICRRAVEIAELEGPQTLVALTHVNEALSTMIAQPKVQAIKQCSRLEQLILQSVAAEVERTGVEETTFLDVYTMLKSIATIEGFSMVSITLALAAVGRLSASRILLSDCKSRDLNHRLILNISADDIYYALRKE